MGDPFTLERELLRTLAYPLPGEGEANPYPTIAKLLADADALLEFKNVAVLAVDECLANNLDNEALEAAERIAEAYVALPKHLREGDE